MLANPHDARGEADVVRSVALGATQQNLVQDLSFEPQEGLFALSNVSRAPAHKFEKESISATKAGSVSDSYGGFGIAAVAQGRRDGSTTAAVTAWPRFGGPSA